MKFLNLLAIVGAVIVGMMVAATSHAIQPNLGEGVLNPGMFKAQSGYVCTVNNIQVSATGEGFICTGDNNIKIDPDGVAKDFVIAATCTAPGKSTEETTYIFVDTLAVTSTTVNRVLAVATAAKLSGQKLVVEAQVPYSTAFIQDGCTAGIQAGAVYLGEQLSGQKKQPTFQF